MQGNECKNRVEHGYFAATGFDLTGGDIEVCQGFNSFQEAMIEVKQKINYNDSLCGTISKQDTGTYTIFIKIKTKTNPSWNKADFWRCTNVFYGRRVVSKATSEEIKHSHNFDYYMVGAFDMWGGDIEQRSNINSFDQAYEVLKGMINLDATKCGSICYVAKNSYSVYLKVPKQTNPNKIKEYPWMSTALFFGRTI